MLAEAEDVIPQNTEIGGAGQEWHGGIVSPESKAVDNGRWTR